MPNTGVRSGPSPLVQGRSDAGPHQRLGPLPQRRRQAEVDEFPRLAGLGRQEDHEVLLEHAERRLLLGAEVEVQRVLGDFRPAPGSPRRLRRSPSPVPASELLAAVCEQVEPARRRAPRWTRPPRRPGRRIPACAASLNVLTVDHWFADDALWKDLDRSPGEGFARTFARATP
ncbi:hypothetical protein ACH5AO_18435 [Streptomyces sp. NPDC018964]|uniref:hypothetical protein n=1 Tax=Streptomyces sp. NPDC018964 TaxID=3365058 RepID=UPI0037BB8CAD